MTSKFSRAALIAGLAIGASGLVAVPAEAANGISTANYYVTNPGIGIASSITPESAVVSATVDTGGSAESILPVPSTGLAWNTISGVTITGEQWNDGTAPAVTNTSAKAYAPIDGLPVSGSNSSLSVTVTDPAAANSGQPQPVSNGGADNFSDVTFEYDPVSDYDAVDNLPGPNTQQVQDIQVPTTTGVSSISALIGAFGQAQQTNTGNTPLTPGTKYYFWIIAQAGGTDAAVNVDIAKWADTGNPKNAVPAYNPSYKCYPIAALALDPTLNGYYQAYLAGQNPQVSYPDNAADYAAGVNTNQPAIQGPCPYYFGNTSGALYYQSPNGTFTTPALGKLKVGAKATETAKGADVTVTNASAYKASGTVDLTIGRKLAGTVKFGLQPKAKGKFKIVLTAKGKAALRAHKTVKVAPVSQTANIASVSNWDQPITGKSVKL